MQWVPIRSSLGIAAFGINGYRASATGQRLIEQHDERANGHEELYVVIAGHAQFTVDGQEFDAPAGTLIAIHDPAVARTATALEPGTVVIAVGSPRGGIYAPSQWERSALAHREIRAGGTGPALESLRSIAGEIPESPWRRYDYACGLALVGQADEAIAELRRAIDAEPEARDAARADPDFATLRDRADWRDLTDA